MIDIGFGDAGKGSLTASLCGLLGGFTLGVRFNGGPQAAHRVVDRQGEHVFHMFSSGTLKGLPTLLSREVVVGPEILAGEAESLHRFVGNSWHLMMLDYRALVITPWQRAANVLDEMARSQPRGTVGTGVRPCLEMSRYLPSEYSVRVGDFQNPSLLVEKLQAHSRLYGDLAIADISVYKFAALCRSIALRAKIVDGDEVLSYHLTKGKVIFEGAHGVLLDDRVGFFPYTTASRCTDAGMRAVIESCGIDPAIVYILAIMRCYSVRHGHGPFPTEDPSLGFGAEYNVDNRLQGPFRVGHTDVPCSRYAVRALTSCNGLCVTHVDALESPSGRRLRLCREYDAGRHHVLDSLPNDRVEQVAITRTLAGTYGLISDELSRPEAVAEAVGVPLVATSAGEKLGDKRIF